MYLSNQEFACVQYDVWVLSIRAQFSVSVYGNFSGKWNNNIFWNSRKGENLGCGISHRVFSFHLIFLLEVQELSVEWFVFRKFNKFRIFWKLSKKRVNHVTLFRKFWYFPLNGKRPLSSSCFGVFIDGVSLSHLAILCAWGEGRGGEDWQESLLSGWFQEKLQNVFK